MTHSNHRRGDRESLEGDWVVFCFPSLDNPPEAHREFLDILTRHDPVGCTTNAVIGDTRKRLRYSKYWEKKHDSGIHESVTLDEIKNTKNTRGGSAVYDNKGNVQKVVNDLVKAELGLSVIISGIFDEVYDICEKAGIEAHTVNMSAETLGNMSLMPEPDILEFTTMCGHAFIANTLVRHLLERVKSGRMTPEQASVEMGKQCTCNFFNVERGTKLINKYLEKHN
jgi:hypothetical protein